MNLQKQPCKHVDAVEEEDEVTLRLQLAEALKEARFVSSECVSTLKEMEAVAVKLASEVDKLAMENNRLSRTTDQLNGLVSQACDLNQLGVLKDSLAESNKLCEWCL